MKTSTAKNHIAHPLNSSKDLDALMERIGDADVVCLGEASHGTHEYYTWRSAITRRLITEKNFRFIAVEGDWPDCYRLNRYIKHYDNQDKTPAQLLAEFRRWPTWMWANWEIAALIEWLKAYNVNRSQMVGFYGLDVYSLWESLDTMISYLAKNDPAAARIAEKAMDCLSANGRDEQRYAVNSLSSPCRDQVAMVLREMREKAFCYDHDPEATLNMIQNAHVGVEAERYYRNMLSFDDQTWNIRDRHMMATLNRLLQYHGPCKAVVWEHNTHIGDARYTSMKSEGMVNIGQLLREQLGDDKVVLVGFGSYKGTVIAGDSWGAEMREMHVPDAVKGSLEDLLHEESTQNRLLIFNENDDRFDKVLPHRAIGVVYDPEREYGNYVPSDVRHRYDAFIYLNHTRALHPLHIKADSHQMPESYPFAV